MQKSGDPVNRHRKGTQEDYHLFDDESPDEIRNRRIRDACDNSASSALLGREVSEH